MKGMRVLMALLLMLTIVGCGKGTKQLKTDKANKVSVPAWYLDPPVDKDRSSNSTYPSTCGTRLLITLVRLR